jgi:hypothetical protein
MGMYDDDEMKGVDPLAAEKARGRKEAEEFYNPMSTKDADMRHKPAPMDNKIHSMGQNRDEYNEAWKAAHDQIARNSPPAGVDPMQAQIAEAQARQAEAAMAEEKANLQASSDAYNNMQQKAQFNNIKRTLGRR